MPIHGYCRVSDRGAGAGLPGPAGYDPRHVHRLHLGEPAIIWDDGVSTSAVPFNERPGIIRLLRSLRADDHLVVWRLDRIERGFLTFYDALRQIVERDVWIHSIEEKGGQAIDLNTAQGRAFVAVLQIGCDMYRETVKENTRRALEWRKKNGMAVSQTGFARRIVVRNRAGNPKPRQQFDKHAGDVKLVEWDHAAASLHRRDRGAVGAGRRSGPRGGRLLGAGPPGPSRSAVGPGAGQARQGHGQSLRMVSSRRKMVPPGQAQG